MTVLLRCSRWLEQLSIEFSKKTENDSPRNHCYSERNQSGWQGQARVGREKNMTDFNEMSGGVENLAANSPLFRKPAKRVDISSILPAERRGQDAGGQRSSLLAHRLLRRKTAKPSPLWRATTRVRSKSNIADSLLRTPPHPAGVSSVEAATQRSW
ncbi:hypothetical protein CFBP5877_28655 (plasmid) [Agrobacterium tumefaciens]|uniref:Uncharacterized protein n=1 Tax=Agrobacterium tumefaciens TaxID=358 RepID=A0AAE6BI90_AGRTU|nr:hypothetical protein CFBP5499_29480 [Agrobacterium tumefaciens]QCL83064.1 hypothetical protein CFBP5877_28655 [Agrobacterium tumefaciens]